MTGNCRQNKNTKAKVAMVMIAGLDVGGAHLKVALVEDGRTVAAEQIGCPLWKGIEFLDAALTQAIPLTDRANAVAITMTGELSDIFSNRHQGVITLADHLEAAFPGKTHYWCGTRSFYDAKTAKQKPADVASMNFLAAAEFTARRVRDGLYIDMGSTTTDIIPVANGRAVPYGLTDAERLETGELVYTGLTRTALMGLIDRMPFQGRSTALTHEYFATIADVYRILGTLPKGVDLHDTADGKGKSVEESVDRLARMLGRDASDGVSEDWIGVAKVYAERQLKLIEDGLRQVLSKHTETPQRVVVCAGIGADVISTLASRLDLDQTRFEDVANANDDCRLEASHAAPAVAVAQLLAASHNNA